MKVKRVKNSAKMLLNL